LIIQDLVNRILKSTCDLYDLDKTPKEHRHQAFKLLQQLIEKKFEIIDTSLNKNILFSIISNNYNINKDDRIFDDSLLR
jgi:hypothetical protein